MYDHCTRSKELHKFVAIPLDFVGSLAKQLKEPFAYAQSTCCWRKKKSACDSTRHKPAAAYLYKIEVTHTHTKLSTQTLPFTILIKDLQTQMTSNVQSYLSNLCEVAWHLDDKKISGGHIMSHPLSPSFGLLSGPPVSSVLSAWKVGRTSNAVRPVELSRPGGSADAKAKAAKVFKRNRNEGHGSDCQLTQFPPNSPTSPTFKSSSRWPLNNRKGLLTKHLASGTSSGFNENDLLIPHTSLISHRMDYKGVILEDLYGSLSDEQTSTCSSIPPSALPSSPESECACESQLLETCGVAA